jgi:hypothetical protein
LRTCFQAAGALRSMRLGMGTATYDLELRSLAYFPVKNGRAK